MRLALAVGGVAVFVLVAVSAVALRPAAPIARAAAASEAPRATADPGSFIAVDPETERGRLAIAERTDRRLIVVRGLRLPIDGLGLPVDPLLLPNSPRDYRAGWHEGIDFPAAAGTSVRAVAAGSVIR